MPWVKFVLNTKSIYKLNYYWHHIWYFYYIRELSSNKKWINSKTEDIWTIFLDLVFRETNSFSTIILKVKILFVFQYNCAYSLLVLFHLSIKKIVRHAMKKIESYFKAIKDTISQNCYHRPHINLMPTE